MLWIRSVIKKNLEENWVEDISLRDAMNRLGERERHIIDLRFYEGKTQMEVADEIGISQAQVSRLEKHALRSMRNYLRIDSSLFRQKAAAEYLLSCRSFLSLISALSQFLRSRSEAPSALHISYLRIPECAMVHKHCTGFLKHLIYCCFILIPFFTVSPVLIRDLPLFFRIALAVVEPGKLGVLINVDPEFHDHSAPSQKAPSQIH